MTFTPRERALSLAAVIVAAFSVGVSFGIGFPLTSLTLEAWGEPKWVLGLAGATPAIAILLILPFLPAVVGRVGAVPAIVSGCVLAGLGFLGLATVSSAWAWIAIRFAMSAGMALPWLVSETWINTVATDGTRGRVVALYAVAFFLGFAIGPQLLDWLGHGIWPFTAGAAATALAGLPIILARRLAPDLTHDEPLGTLQAFRLAPVGMIGGFIGGVSEITYLSLLPNVAIATGIGQTEALRLLTMLSIGAGVLQFLVGWLADKVDKVALSLLLAVAFLALTLALPFVINDSVLAAVTVFLLGGIMLGFYTAGLSIIGETVQAKDIAAANAAFLIMYQAGGILGPFIAGVAMTDAPVFGFVVTVSALIVVSSFVLWWAARRG